MNPLYTDTQIPHIHVILSFSDLIINYSYSYSHIININTYWASVGNVSSSLLSESQLYSL